MSENKEIERNLEEIPADAAEPETMAEEIPEQSENETIKPQGNFKTVQQLALEYGMTKNGIVVRINKMLKEVKEKGLKESDYVTRGKRNTMYVMESGLVWLAKFNDENSPMQSMSVSPEFLKMKHTEELNEQLKSEIEILKRQLGYLQSDLNSKNEQINFKNEQIAAMNSQISSMNNQITGLVGTIATQMNTIESQYKTIMTLTASKEDEAENAPKASETAPTQSDDKTTAESPKTSFWGKLMHLFG